MRSRVMHFTISIPPRSKKNSMQILVNQKTRRPFISPSNAYKAYREAALMLIPAEARQGIGYPVNVCAVFRMPTRRKVDVVNLQEALLDVLVDAGVLAGFGACVMVFIMLVSFAVWCLDRDKIEDEETEEGEDE